MVNGDMYVASFKLDIGLAMDKLLSIKPKQAMLTFARPQNCIPKLLRFLYHALVFSVIFGGFVGGLRKQPLPEVYLY